MNIKPFCFSVVLGSAVFLQLIVFGAPFPFSLNTGYSHSQNQSNRMEIIIGDLSSQMGGSAHKMEVGYLSIKDTSFAAFLNSDAPIAAQPDFSLGDNPPAHISEARTIRLSWRSALSPVSITYHLYVGNSPDQMRKVVETKESDFTLINLEYNQTYFWKVMSVDIYGRFSESEVFHFMVLPPIETFYCAPNPFNPSRESTTFVFNMPGPGSADIKVYLLPHLEEVFNDTLTGLSDGANAFDYRGVDSEGKKLFNGVYLADIRLKGAREHVSQRFKFIVAH